MIRHKYQKIRCVAVNRNETPFQHTLELSSDMYRFLNLQDPIVETLPFLQCFHFKNVLDATLFFVEVGLY